MLCSEFRSLLVVYENCSYFHLLLKLSTLTNTIRNYTDNFYLILFLGLDENSTCELLVDDVPGSNLDLSKLNTYRVDQLKFWLSCRGDKLRKLPTKAACIQRHRNPYSSKFSRIMLIV